MEIFDWQNQDVLLISGVANTPLLFMICILRAHHICKCISHIYFPQILPSETTKQPETIPRYKSHTRVTGWLQPGYNRAAAHQCDIASHRKFSLWELGAQNWYSHRDNHKLLLLSSCIITSSAAAHPQVSTQKNPKQEEEYLRRSSHWGFVIPLAPKNFKAFSYLVQSTSQNHRTVCVGRASSSLLSRAQTSSTRTVCSIFCFH